MTVAELASKLMADQRISRLAKHSHSWQPSMTPATDLGYACDRRIVYHRCWPLRAQPIGEELASIFEEGNLHQTNVRTELAQLGYEVVEQEVNFRDNLLQITGTIDGKIMLAADDGGRPRRIPIEIKSTSGVSPKNAEEWRTSETPLLARYYAQLQIYLLLTNEPEGLALFKSKLTGLWSLVAISLDYAYTEGLLQRAERVRDAVARVVTCGADETAKLAQLPDRIASREGCDSCPWRDTMCHPAEAIVDPLLIAQDVDLNALLHERDQLDEARKRYAKIDQNVKCRFKMTAGDRFATGDYLIVKKVTANSTRIDIRPLAEKAEQL